MKKLIKKIKGFTLIELLAVLVILAILVAVAFPAVSRYLESSRKNTFKSNASIAIDVVRTDIVASDIYNQGVTTGVTAYQTNGYKYSLEVINTLLDKKLEKTSYSTDYDLENSYVTAVPNADNTGYVYHVCLTDEDNSHTIDADETGIEGASITTNGCNNN